MSTANPRAVASSSSGLDVDVGVGCIGSGAERDTDVCRGQRSSPTGDRGVGGGGGGAERDTDVCRGGGGGGVSVCFGGGGDLAVTVFTTVTTVAAEPNVESDRDDDDGGGGGGGGGGDTLGDGGGPRSSPTGGERGVFVAVAPVDRVDCVGVTGTGVDRPGRLEFGWSSEIADAAAGFEVAVPTDLASAVDVCTGVREPPPDGVWRGVECRNIATGVFGAVSSRE